MKEISIFEYKSKSKEYLEYNSFLLVASKIEKLKKL